MTEKKSQPIAYTAPHDVYTGQRYYKAGEVFVTDEPKGKEWETVTKAEKAAIEASSELPKDPPLEALDLSALKAVAFDKKVNPKGLSKDELIQAIQAANDPAL